MDEAIRMSLRNRQDLSNKDYQLDDVIASLISQEEQNIIDFGAVSGSNIEALRSMVVEYSKNYKLLGELRLIETPIHGDTLFTMVFTPSAKMKKLEIVSC